MELRPWPELLGGKGLGRGLGRGVAAVRQWSGRERAGSGQSYVSGPALALTQAERQGEAREPHGHRTALGGRDRCEAQRLSG